MRQYVIDEKNLQYLLYCEMELCMLQTDGVDNWTWYGESRPEVKAEFYPGDWDELNEDDQFDTSFDDIAIMRIEAGEFPQLFEKELELFAHE